MWVGGKEQVGRGNPSPVVDPASGEVIALCHTASPEDVDSAVTAAHAAYESGAWSRAPRHHRADVLDTCATLLSAALPGLIALEVKQTGRPIREIKLQMPSIVKWFKYYASLLRAEDRSVLTTSGMVHNFIARVPLGVVVQITSFNHPLLTAVKKLAPALAAGNSVIVKPSELTPLTTLLLGKILREAGIPDDVFSVLPGPGNCTGTALVEHPLVKKVDLTGGTAAGKAIGTMAAGNLLRFTAELGGKAPLIVFEDAQVDIAVNGIASDRFIASGQTCVASARIIVHNSILDTVLKKLTAKLESIVRHVGVPSNPECAMGPIISAKHLRKVEELVDGAVAGDLATVAAGARRMQGISPLDGFDLSKGSFYEPTLLVSAAGQSIAKSRIWREETFGPVIVLVGFDTEAEAVGLANDSVFGLGAAIWTQDLRRAFRVSEQVQTGITWVNTHHRNDPSSPWGGAKSTAGVGNDIGNDAYHAYSTTKSIIMNFAPDDEPSATDDWFGEGVNNVRYG
ncbi:aldehyde dehydrogenase [Thozetella sp. PMI_491]|nr:aldehyde dehydrogenase [Thozetella sp. PMI_491]